MTVTRFLTAAAAIGAVSAPALAQTSYPQYPQYPQQYPQQGYGYPGQTYPQSGYGGGGAIEQVINQLLGNRYNVTDRTAVRQCAAAAAQQAAAQYGPRYGGYQQGYGQQGYQQGYGQQGYQQGYAYDPMRTMRVTAITNVERRSGGVRVSGLLDSRSGYGGQYGGGYGSGSYTQGYSGGYQGQAYGAGDLSFRCNVDYRGQVTNIRIRPTSAWRRY